MRAKRIEFFLLILIVGFLFNASGVDGVSSSEMTPQQKRGKQIYLRGSSSSGRVITAIIGGGSTELPATALACANCHGFDGRGKPEGGVTPSNIRWDALATSRGQSPDNSRSRPAYTERAFQQAITEGVDPAGNTLHMVMPRYRMHGEDVADLVSYLKFMGQAQEPGVDDAHIRVGTILPINGPAKETGRIVQAVLAGYFDDINSQGGIYGRRIELRAEQADTSAEAQAGVKHLIEQGVFAMVGALSSGADKELGALVEGEELPFIGPLTPLPEIGFPLNRQVFYLLSGLREQSRALVCFAAKRFPVEMKSSAIVDIDKGVGEGLGESIEEQCRRSGLVSMKRYHSSASPSDIAELAQRLSRDDVKAIIFLGLSTRLGVLLKAAEKLNFTPRVLVPGALSSKEIFDAPSVFRGKVFLSFPLLPANPDQAASIEYGAFARRHDLPATHLASQFAAYCAAKVLIEGLKLSGHELTREKLIKALEGLYEFDTGLIPPITYGPNRRIGALGAYIISVDLEDGRFNPIEWIKLD
jgi:ABC-type branched-subunit amino acid transport system substrate-binding protein